MVVFYNFGGVSGFSTCDTPVGTLLEMGVLCDVVMSLIC